MIKVCIILPTYNEEKHIANCLNSILNQDYNLSEVEVLVIDGMSTDKTRVIVNDYVNRFSFIKLLENPLRNVSPGLNLGIKIAQADFILRLDAHAHFPSNYVSCLVSNSLRLGADNIGGIIKTKPANDTSIANSIAIALSHPFGMGNSYFRIGTNKIKQVDTVPFGCFRKEIFDKIGLFDIDLIRNQDDEYNGRIIKNGGKIFIIPDLIIEYYSRESIQKVGKMFYQYGLFKPLVNRKLGQPATIRQFIPPAFVLLLFAGSFFSLFCVVFFKIFVFVLVLYFSISFFISFTKIKKKQLEVFYELPVVFFVIHLSYGLGYFIGIYKFLIKKNAKIQVNATR